MTSKYEAMQDVVIKWKLGDYNGNEAVEVIDAILATIPPEPVIVPDEWRTRVQQIIVDLRQDSKVNGHGYFEPYIGMLSDLLAAPQPEAQQPAHEITIDNEDLREIAQQVWGQIEYGSGNGISILRDLLDKATGREEC